MIIQIKGKVNFPITLDPSVWIFDDRKIKLEEAFDASKTIVKDKVDPLKKADQLFSQALYFEKHIKPPVNKSLNKHERKEALLHSFVMPIKDFIDNAEPMADSKNVRLTLTNNEEVIITKSQLLESVFQFAIDGKQIKLDQEGPVYLIFGDGSNQDAPIKGIKSISLE